MMGEKAKTEISKQLTPEKLASAALKVGKIALKSAPALAGGPAAFGAALMANGGKEIAASVAIKAKEKMTDPEFQKKVVQEGVKMTAQAFSKPAESPGAG